MERQSHLDPPLPVVGHGVPRSATGRRAQLDQHWIPAQYNGARFIGDKSKPSSSSPSLHSSHLFAPPSKPSLLSSIQRLRESPKSCPVRHPPSHSPTILIRHRK